MMTPGFLLKTERQFQLRDNGGGKLAEVVSMKHISKSFPGVKALSDVTLDLEKGEVMILLGENGAGKSTLMKILAGVYPKDAGELFFEGTPVSIQCTKDAEKYGIFMIYQELNLVPDLSVAENLFLGREVDHKYGFVNFKAMYKKADAILKELNLHIDSKALVRDLSVAQSQMVEISRALIANAKVIIMDEPTAAITDQETAELFKQIRRLTKEGVSILYISHRLQEVLEIGDRIYVMRDGCHIETVDAKSTTRDELIKMMVGRELGDLFPKEIQEKGDVVLEVSHMENQYVHDVSFSVREGEVLGFAGLMGAGRTELMRAITGADRIKSGVLYLRGKRAAIHSPMDSVKQKIAFVTEDRKKTGIIAGLPIDINITLSSLNLYSNTGFLSHKKEEEISERYIHELKIKTPDVNTDIATLSGGNQQKVILARWLAIDADVVILDEPTRGIDVGAKREIYMLINELTRMKKAVILVSSDLPEVLGMSDRCAVMAGGRITGFLDREEADQVSIMQLATKDVMV